MEYRENADIMYGIYDLNEFTYEQTINKHHYMMEAFPLPGKTFFSFTGKKVNGKLGLIALNENYLCFVRIGNKI